MTSLARMLCRLGLAALAACAGRAGEPGENRAALVDDGGVGEAGSEAAGVGLRSPTEPAIVGGVCLRADGLLPAKVLALESGLLRGLLSPDPIDGAAVVSGRDTVHCQFTVFELDAAGVARSRQIARTDFDFNRTKYTPESLAQAVGGVPGLRASIVAVNPWVTVPGAFRPGAVDVLVTVDSHRAAPIEDATDAAGLAALDALRAEDLGVATPSDAQNGTRQFIRSGRSSLSFKTAQQVAKHLSVASSRDSSGHFVIGDRITLAVTPDLAQPALVMAVGPTSDHKLDPLRVLVVDDANRLVVREVDELTATLSLAAGVVPSR